MLFNTIFAVNLIRKEVNINSTKAVVISVGKYKYISPQTYLIKAEHKFNELKDVTYLPDIYSTHTANSLAINQEHIKK